MADPRDVLAQRVSAALGAAFGPEYEAADPVIRPSSFADYQSNAALPLAKKLGRPPRDIAADIVGQLDLDGVAEPPEVSGPGFINFRLLPGWIAGQASEQLADPRLGVAQADPAPRVVVEYSSPNVAKEMHVGHLRTTIVGDALARILEFAGQDVIRDNHLGDWGTPFGMLIEHLLDVGEDSADADQLRSNPNAFYQAARRKFDSDPEFAERARQRVVLLQGGDESTLQLWQHLVDMSLDYLHRIYRQLGVTLTDADIRGESFYNDLLAEVCAELEASGVAVISDGALCAFPPGFTGRDGEPLPVIIRKRDGGYNYSTSDLATIRYRIRDLHVDRAIYVVGSSQALHFQMVFAVARQAGWIPAAARFEHAQIGNVLGTDGKLLRTRAGDSIKLSELLREGVERARKVFDELNTSPEFDESERAAIAEAVGIGAIKYADLSTARDSEYVFDWDRMISFRGEHRALPPVRDRADPVHLPPGRPRPGRRPRPDHAGRAGRAGPRAAPARVRSRGPAGRGDHAAAPAGGFPVRGGQRVHHVLRAVPGAPGGRPVHPGQPAGAVRADPARPADRAGPARDPGS